MEKMLIYKEDELPVRSGLIAWAEFIELCDCPPSLLAELMGMGWFKPAQSASKGDLYRQADVYRVRKLTRICADFELPLVGGTIIVDLLSRVSELERKLGELRAATGK